MVNLFFGSSHWKIPGPNGNSEKLVLFSWLGHSEWKQCFFWPVRYWCLFAYDGIGSRRQFKRWIMLFGR